MRWDKNKQPLALRIRSNPRLSPILTGEITYGVIRVATAKSNDYTYFTYFRHVFRREMYTQVVANMKKVGLMTDRNAENLRKLGIDPAVDGRAYTLEEQTNASDGI